MQDKKNHATLLAFLMDVDGGTILQFPINFNVVPTSKTKRTIQFPLTFLTDLDRGITLQLIDNDRVLIIQSRTARIKVNFNLN